MTKLLKKLNHKYYDSFKIEVFVKKEIYRFHLLKIFKNIYNVFYILLFEFHRKNLEKQFSSIIIYFNLFLIIYFFSNCTQLY